jgi:hypothetical protein
MLLRPLNGVLYQPQMMIVNDECGAVSGMLDKVNLLTIYCMLRNVRF